MNKITNVGELLEELNLLSSDTPVRSEQGFPLYVGLSIKGNKSGFTETFVIYGNFKDINVDPKTIEVKKEYAKEPMRVLEIMTYIRTLKDNHYSMNSILKFTEEKYNISNEEAFSLFEAAILND